MTFSFNFVIDDLKGDLHTTRVSENEAQVESSSGNEAAVFDPSLLSTEPYCVQMATLCINNVNAQSEPDIRLFRRDLRDVYIEMAQKDEMSGTDGDKPVVDALCSAITGKSDLIPGVYEGGAKTWECTFDLICYLAVLLETRSELEKLAGRSVLELGCGSGLPGIYCLLNGQATSVDFQDFNREVLEYVTLPNILANSAKYGVEQEEASFEMEISTRNLASMPRLGQLWSGDWQSFSQVAQKQYDMIISSETVYQPQSYPKLLSVLKDCLRVSETSMAVFACKNFYFGCGGSSIGFANYIEDRGAHETLPFRLSCQSVAKFGQDSLLREILLIQWVSSQPENV